MRKVHVRPILGKAALALSLAMCLPASAQNYGMETAQPIGSFLDGVFPSTTPGPSGAWGLVDAFPDISFIGPVRVAVAPNDADDLYVVCRNGEIWKMPDDPTATSSQRVRFLDRRSTTWGYWDAGMMSLSFHPEFGTAGSPNRGYCYVYYQYSPSPSNSSNTNPSYMRLSRFTVPDGTDQVDSSSELVLIQQFDRHNWHGGGQSFFGTDGFLYVVFGDEGNANDSYDVTQKIDDRIFSGILRIDVDQDPARSHPIRRQPQALSSRPAGWPASFTQGYFIPDDNPWQNPSGGTLEEFWTIGLRSPHSMHLDRGTGNVWVAEVGQGAREEVTIARMGGNHQWPFKEGLINGPRPIPSPLIGIENPPIYDYPRADGGCTIGGIVYRGTEFAGSLTGKYLFGDHNSRKLWAMTYVPGEAPQIEFLTSVFRSGGTKRGLSGISANALGEPYICELGETGTNTGKIYRLTRSGTPIPDPPALLSQAGAFSDLATLEPRSGLLPYEVNSQLWSDNAEKRRWIAIPNDGSHNTAAEQIQFSQQGNWEFPIGTVIVKHFELPVDENNPNILRRLETRFLVKGTDGMYYGVTYRWNAQGTDATLLSDGQDEEITITQIGGSTRQQTWSYPSRSDCRTCHTQAAGHVLGLRTHGLNRDMHFPATDRTDNILRAWNHVGIFSPSLAEADIPGFLKAADVQDSSRSKTHRVRSWLDSNCSHCHQPGGVLANFDARFTTPFGNQGLVNGTLNGSYPVTDPRVVAPGDLSRSILYQRDNSLGSSAMPPLAKNLIHAEAMSVMAQWIDSLPSNLTQLAGTSASQSSTSSGGDAARAIDGATDGDWNNGSVTLTANTANPWWEIDLGEVLDIDHLVIWPRTDCCSERMDGYYVFVSDIPFTSNDLATTIGQAGVYSQQFTTRPSPTQQVFANRSGRYVRIQLTGSDPLSLAEVEIFGIPPITAPTAPIISNFLAIPSTIDEGNATTLSWGIDDGGSPLSAVSIDNGVGSVFGSSSVNVSPTTSTTYTLTATNSEGFTTASATVTVTPSTGGSGDEFVADSDTVALYHFNGNYADSSSNNSDLTAAGGVARTSSNLGWMNDPAGQVARFSSIGDSLSVAIPDAIVLPGSGQPLTIDARIYPNAWLGYSIDNLPIISFHQEWNAHFVIEDPKWGTNPKGPEIVSSGSDLVTAQQWAAAVSLGQWHQVRIEYDGVDTVTCSIDGVEISNGTLPPDTDRSDDWILTLGNFDGDLDEVFITRSIIVDEADTTAPTVAISTPSTTVNRDFTVDVSFNENVTGFTLGDISVTNGSASALTGSGSSYSFNVSPVAIGNVTVQLPSGAASDAAGNPSIASNVLSVDFDDTPVDTTPPTVVISTPSTAVSSDFTVTASFSENVSGLELNDISVTNGSASALTGNGNSYSFNITPVAIGNVMVQLDPAAASDAAGNPSDASNLLIVDFDDTPPGGGDEHVVDANTVALYHFNSDYGDSSPNQLDLAVGGGVQLSADNLGWMGTPAGQVARFTTIGDTLSVPIPDNFLLVAGDTRPITIEARIYPRSWLGYSVDNLPVIVLDQDWDTNLTFEDSKWGTSPKGPRILSAGIPITTASQWASAAPLDQWAQLQISFDGTSNVSAWINGQPAGSVTLEPNIDRNANWALTLGNFDGDLDEVYIHRSAPSATSQAQFAVTAAQAAAASALGTSGEIDSQLDADPDGDGRVNLLEVALGSDPMLNDAVPITLDRTPGGEIAITFPVPSASQATAAGYESAAFTYTVQASQDLKDWEVCSVTQLSERTMPDDFRMVTLQIDSSTEAFEFFRLQVTTR